MSFIIVVSAVIAVFVIIKKSRKNTTDSGMTTS